VCRNPGVNSSSLNYMFRVAPGLQQKMSEPSGAVTEANTIVAITKTVLELVTKFAARYRVFLKTKFTFGGSGRNEKCTWLCSRRHVYNIT